MKRYFLGALVSFAFVGVGCLCVYAKDCTEQIPVVSSDITVPSVHVVGNDDGHCNYCGPKNVLIFVQKVELTQQSANAGIQNGLMLILINCK